MQNTNGRKVVGKRRKEREGELARKIWGKDTQSISITFQAFSSIFTPPITPAGTETIGPTYDIQTSEIQLGKGSKPRFKIGRRYVLTGSSNKPNDMRLCCVDSC